ncbi:MAG TPA: hypothetical protein VN915_17620 [Elusimicrobiota bacterium]|nr:hypothetical protein [Elusimicrobiota bacterium]
MRALLLILLLAPLAGAVDMEEPGEPALRAKNAIEALPLDARLELRRMYMRYRDEVAKRVEQGWEPALLSDAVIEDVDDPFQPARLLEDAEKNRKKFLADLQAKLAKMNRDDAEYGRQMRRIDNETEVVQRAEKKNAREKGICRDWSDDVWFLLTQMNLEQWTVDDRRRTSRPYHSAAVACAPQDAPTVCLAFDPWTEGKPSVYAFQAWDDKEPGARLPAEYFLHGLPEKAP